MHSHTLRVAAAWAVHALTMSGLVWALLALRALWLGDVLQMWGWLAVALIVDGVDGGLAQRARVKELVPWFDGTTLDNVIDYLTWTFIPAVFVALHIPLGGSGAAWAAAIVICVSSVFCYCNTGVKSSDFYFVGFPAAWNIVAVALAILVWPAWANWLAIAVLAFLTLVPWTYLHPFRVTRLMPVNIAAVLIWIVATGVLLVQQPERPMTAFVLWWASGLWFLLVSALRTVLGPDAGAVRSRADAARGAGAPAAPSAHI